MRGGITLPRHADRTRLYTVGMGTVLKLAGLAIAAIGLAIRTGAWARTARRQVRRLRNPPKPARVSSPATATIVPVEVRRFPGARATSPFAQERLDHQERHGLQIPRR